MIDWVSCIFTARGSNPRSGGLLVLTKQDGTIEKSTPRFFTVNGSHESSVQLRARSWNVHGDVEWYLSGNPAKWFAGFNLFGSDSPAYISRWVQSVLDSSVGGHLQGDIRLTRVDLTYNFCLPTPEDVHLWISSAAPYVRGRRQAGSARYSGTLYVGQNSKKHSVKIYAKGPEQRLRKPKIENFPLDQYLDFCDSVLRIEVTMRETLKKRRADKLSAWTDSTARDLWISVVSGVSLPKQVALKDAPLDGLPTKLRSTHELWRMGYDLREMLPRATFFRHRRELLTYGIDISERVRPAEARVVPLLRPLEATPAAPPQWLRPWLITA